MVTNHYRHMAFFMYIYRYILLFLHIISQIKIKKKSKSFFYCCHDPLDNSLIMCVYVSVHDIIDVFIRKRNFSPFLPPFLFIIIIIIIVPSNIIHYYSISFQVSSFDICIKRRVNYTCDSTYSDEI